MGKKSGSGSGIRDEQPGSYFLELRNQFFGLKYLNSLMRIRDPGWKKVGSGINIPDPQHWIKNYRILPFLKINTTNFFRQVDRICSVCKHTRYINLTLPLRLICHYLKIRSMRCKQGIVVTSNILVPTVYLHTYPVNFSGHSDWLTRFFFNKSTSLNLGSACCYSEIK